MRSLLAANLGAAGAQVASGCGIAIPALSAGQVMGGNVAAELAEKSVGAHYPLFRVSCSKVANTLREKFRTFSGQAEVTVEALVTQDRLDGIEDQLHGCVEAVTAVLDANRGDWGGGALYNGGYEVTFGAVKHGGKNFLQSARIVIAVDVSK
ncbi:MAG TPA: hypothetical protein VFA04_24365 [Bryobacteraceae bacterium]|nr:hypothetical protein [Bryobacteraceae bacterium]